MYNKEKLDKQADNFKIRVRTKRKLRKAGVYFENNISNKMLVQLSKLNRLAQLHGLTKPLKRKLKHG